ncbi:MAG: VanZ family protein [Bacteroidetes bacterium]|nr:MAG: VanZ family protein [Bacteroidota bacterium]
MPRLRFRLLPALLTAYGVLLLGLTLFPFSFQPGRIRALGVLLPSMLTWRDTGFWEPLGNVVLFVPLGLMLAAWRAWPAPLTVRQAGFLTALCVAGSLGIELLQLLTPVRTPSLKDVVLNGAGGGLGVVLYALGWALLAPGVSPRRIARWLLGTCGGVVLATLVLGGVPWSWGLASWDPASPLVLGAAQDRAPSWHGLVHDLYIGAAALDDAAIARLLTSGPPGSSSGSSPGSDAALSHYPLRCDSLCPDAGGRLPPLHRLGPPVAPAADGIRLRRGRGYRTLEAPTALTERARRQSAFTLVLAFTPEADLHRGPAPLLSLPSERTERNLLIGQEWQALHLFLRTPANGPRADRVVFVVPGVFERGVTRRMALRYDRGTLSVAFAEAPGPYRLRITPETALLWWTAYAFGPYHIDLTTATRPDGVIRLVPWLYDLLVFFPLGLLLAAFVRTSTRHRTRRLLAGWLLMPLFLHAVLLPAGGLLSLTRVGGSLLILGLATGIGLLTSRLGTRLQPDPPQYVSR